MGRRGIRHTGEDLGERAGVRERRRRRAGAAWLAPRGDEPPLPAPVRRWLWALAAAAAGAAGGAAVAYVLRRVQTGDADGAVDPAAVQAVVDRRGPARPAAAAAAPPASEA